LLPRSSHLHYTQVKAAWAFDSFPVDFCSDSRLQRSGFISNPSPMLSQELRVRGSYLHHKEIKAAQGVKIAAQNLESAVAGTQMLVAGPNDDVEVLKAEVMEDMKDIFGSVDRSGSLSAAMLVLQHLTVLKVETYVLCKRHCQTLKMPTCILSYTLEWSACTC